MATVPIQYKHKFNVKMTCSGCSGAITRALNKAKDDNLGITDFEVKLDTQEVIVNGSITYATALEKIQKTGKEVLSGQTLD